MILSNSTWAEVKDFVDDSVVAIIPLGSCEQHGLHLPLNTDLWTAEQFAKKALDRVGSSAKILLLPCLPYGVSTTHMYFAGTLTLSAETYIHAVKEICRSIFRHRVKKIVLLNGHAGNSSALAVASTEINLDTGAAVLLVNWWDLCGDVVGKNFGFMFHACESETSVALALGQRVILEKASGTKPSSDVEYVKFNMLSQGIKIQQSSTRTLDELSSTGAVGEPSKTDAKKGEEIVEVTVERLTRLLIEFSKSANLLSVRARTDSPALQDC